MAVPKEFKGRVVCLDDMPSDAIMFTPNKPANPTNAIFCMYTSGTTGKPNGAIIEHRGVVKEIQYLQVCLFPYT